MKVSSRRSQSKAQNETPEPSIEDVPVELSRKQKLREKKIKNKKSRGLSQKAKMRKVSASRMMKGRKSNISPGGAISQLRANNKLIVDFVKRYIFMKSDVVVPELVCSHILVGSASVERLLKGTFDLGAAHMVDSDSVRKRKGKRAEEYFMETLCEKAVPFIDHPFGRHPRFPFICAVPDFIVQTNDGLEINEVKSSTTAESLFHPSVLERYSLQILIARDCFSLKKAKMIPVVRNEFDGCVVHQKLDAVDFSGRAKLDNKLLVKNYVLFLDKYFSRYFGFGVSEDMKRTLEKMFLDYKPRRQKKARAINDIPNLKRDHTKNCFQGS